MKDINIFLTHNSNNELEDENGIFLIKLWNSLKLKSIKNKKKLQSSYEINDTVFQNVDNECHKKDI
tara:strand:- start:5476 stop:5673 length:198 start_codon:yes stop_codon:yes gene_type:complete